MRVYNTLTKQKQEFKPNNYPNIGMYVCGVTVYDNCHIGHARAYLCFDVIIRHLKLKGYKVNYVRNITDIDDKIINRAAELKVDYSELTDKYIKSMHEDFKALNILEPTAEPRATEFMPQMIKLIQDLEAKGFAYAADNGDVYYAVNKFKNYGQLSNRNLDDMQAGSRVDVNDAKQNPLDFVLWKKSKPGEPAWDSPWGEGRPGWHLECSAMAMDLLGENFDIHGGGFDLTFPHHENECAQSEAVSGKQFVNYWMHVGFLQIDQEKMSKSLGNFSTIKDTLKEVPAEVLRYFMISKSYRSPLDYSEDNIKNAVYALDRMYTAIRGLDTSVAYPHNTEYEIKYIKAMDDDFNTPEALAVLFDLVREINKLKDSDVDKANSYAALLKHLTSHLGILTKSAEEYFTANTNNELDGHLIENLIKERNDARASKDFKTADEVRDKLTSMGVVLEDTKDGTIWRAN